jgi:lysophospholipase L1-like esterase
MSTPIRVLAAAVVVGVFLAKSASAQVRVPNLPQPSRVQGWEKTFAYQKQQLSARPADICFVGDSLTEYWSSTGSAVWELEFGEIRAVNFGIAADRTENILYRLLQTNLAFNTPRAFVVLAGTNNLSAEPPDSPEKTVVGIKAIVDLLIKQCPKSRVFLLTLPPNGYEANSQLRNAMLETNQRLKDLKQPERLALIDIYPLFADDLHHWKSGMTIDGTHFSQQGYDHLARALKPAIDSLKANHSELYSEPKHP